MSKAKLFEDNSESEDESFDIVPKKKSVFLILQFRDNNFNY